MICIITGDIVGSRKLKEPWLNSLKDALKWLTAKDSDWEIYRGDSFQLEVRAEEAIKAAVYLKACLRANKGADVRMGVGLGTFSTKSLKLTEANGEAFIHSGSAFDSLKIGKVNLSVKTSDAEFDEEINVMIKLALIAMDSWGTVAAEVVRLALTHEKLLQNELAALSGRTQSSISEALKRAHYAEIIEMDSLYRKKLNKILKK